MPAAPCRQVMAKNMSSDSSLVSDMRQQEEDVRKMRHLMATGDTEVLPALCAGEACVPCVRAQLAWSQAARELIKRLDPKHVTEEQVSASYVLTANKTLFTRVLACLSQG